MLNILTTKSITYPHVNGPAILAVADAIERHSISWLGFNMAFDFCRIAGDTDYKDHSGFECDTVACIAGWTQIVLNGKKVKKSDPLIHMYDLARDTGPMLGLDWAQARALFYPDDCGIELEHITVKQAVRTLRHLAFTGEVDWDLPAERA